MNEDPRVQIHQMLHGYTDGHGLLASSLKLSARDSRNVLVLSDISGSGAKVDSGGYLTGYPLLESGYYALARTWAAPELPRPGCVWTHTLLIDFTSLANLTYLTGLNALMRRPLGNDQQSYGVPIDYFPPSRSLGLSAKNLDRATALIAALYEQSSGPIVAFREHDVDVDLISLAIWEQQWPRLRRAFRFCTLATSDRSSELAPFDLQLLPERASFILSKFRETVEALPLDSKIGGWLGDAMNDLASPNSTGLRVFGRKIGGETGAGRGDFKTLCWLHVLSLESENHPASINAAVQRIKSGGLIAESDIAKTFLATLFLKNLSDLNDASTLWLIEHLDRLDDRTFDEFSSNLAAHAWSVLSLDLIRVAMASRNFTNSGRRLMELVEALSLDAIFAILSSSEDALEHFVLEVRGDVFINPEFWRRVPDISLAIEDAVRKMVDIDQAFNALLLASRPDLAPAAFSIFGNFTLLSALSQSCNKGTTSLEERRSWLLVGLSDTSSVAEAFTRAKAWDRRLLAEISRLIAPEIIPNEYGVDPWLIAYRASAGLISPNDQMYLSSYLLNRALSGASKSPQELLSLTFEVVYVQAASNSLTEEAWRVLEYRLPWSFFWYDWDRCVRIRNAIVDLHVGSELPPTSFIGLTNKLDLFRQLVETAARDKRGRKYLQRVAEQLARLSEPNSGDKRKLIELAI